MATMRAARYYGNRDIRIEEIEVPEPQPGEVLVEVAWCGICGTDLHEYLDGPIFCPTAAHPISGEEIPITLGHEFSGTVAALGEGVDDLQVGDSVVVEPYIISDDVDTSEANNAYHLSKNMNFIGLAGRGGGLSEKIAVKRRWVHPIGDIPLDEAALIEPLAVGHHAFKQSGGKAGDVAIIGGLGPIGVLLAAILKAKGLTVIATELSELRRKRGTDTGVVDHALNPAEVDVLAEVDRITGGKGADIAFECTSVDVVLNQLLAALKPTGTLVNVSIWGHKPAIDMHTVVMKELTIRGTIAYCNDHPETIKLVQEGKIDLKPFITGKIGLENLVDEGFDTLINRNETAVKIIVSPTL